ncbi:glycerophosphoryl diester phosphodiesterase membrane domain-containing protein [Erythrobacter sp. JK5]|uniref:glycerophosphoryl diester phosphodiesterase membrane domain-containing protein n=1 Tax=Erythrobacter sp. JK5 TaxID=2829500 RepID=UPI001BA875E5|nr:glycerophosphoryl diester phosphodiesterase membrane domain-containing protein [Erythrobacter sp. JK5]QUL36708.1 glycerophosphoryl diester phosphodiesterase membrane domain-containing protein [Erythrobacter sp. JK5]
MQLNMGQAWSDATGILGANRDTVLAVAGLFFFLPSFTLALIVPEAINPAPVNAPPGTDPQVAMNAAWEAVAKQYIDNWPLFLLLSLAQFIGTLSLLALLTDRARPTVGEALQRGLKSTPSYLAAQICVALFAGVVVGVPLGLLGAFAPPALTIMVGLVLVLVLLYLMIKFSLIAPVIAIESELNPINAMRRSWQLTKGNSFRLVAFFLLLIIAIGVVSLLFTLVLGTVFAAFGDPVANIGTALVSSLVNAAVAVLVLGVLAAIHRQLSGSTSEAVANTFE